MKTLEEIESDLARLTAEVEAIKVTAIPPKPDGDGWEWRPPQPGDDFQFLSKSGEPVEIGRCTDNSYVDGSPDNRPFNNYRWCRPKPAKPVAKPEPEVRRTTYTFFTEALGLVERVPIVSHSEGKWILDTESIAREQVVAELETLLEEECAATFAERIRIRLTELRGGE